MDALQWVADEMTRQASNLRRYPYESATMNEAARMASDALLNIRKQLLAQGTEAQRAETVKHGSVHDGPVAESDAPTPSPSGEQ